MLKVFKLTDSDKKPYELHFVPESHFDANTVKIGAFNIPKTLEEQYQIVSEAIINQLHLDKARVGFVSFSLKEKKDEAFLDVTYHTIKKGFHVDCAVKIPVSRVTEEDIMALQNQSDEPGDIYEEKAEALKRQKYTRERLDILQETFLDCWNELLAVEEKEQMELEFVNA